MDAAVPVQTFDDGAPRAAPATGGPLRALVGAWMRARRRAAGLREMQGMSEATLRDIGLARSELSSAMAEWHGDAPATRRLVLHALSHRGVA